MPRAGKKSPWTFKLRALIHTGKQNDLKTERDQKIENAAQNGILERRTIMEELNMNRLDESELTEATGGAASAEGVKVRPISPIWVKVTASSLNCRYTPNGEVAKVYEKGHRLKVDGITADGEWYRLLIYNPKGGTCYAYIAKKYTVRD